MDVTLKALKANLHTVTLGDTTVWFSYETAVAYATPEQGTVVSINAWTGTTGAHLSLIDGGTAEARKARLDRAQFVSRLRQVLHLNAFAL